MGVLFLDTHVPYESHRRLIKGVSNTESSGSYTYMSDLLQALPMHHPFHFSWMLWCKNFAIDLFRERSKERFGHIFSLREI